MRYVLLVDDGIQNTKMTMEEPKTKQIKQISNIRGWNQDTSLHKSSAVNVEQDEFHGFLLQST
jgi:hypothetical protein